MPVPLDEDTRVSIPASVLAEIEALTPRQSKHVGTELVKITSAGYRPSKLVYKQYGDLTVFRCGDVMRLFGVVVEDLDVVADFDHLVVVLEVTEHDYQQAGVTRTQAGEIHSTFSSIDSEAAFREALDGVVFDADDVRDIFDDDS